MKHSFWQHVFLSAIKKQYFYFYLSYESHLYQIMRFLIIYYQINMINSCQQYLMQALL